MGEVKFYRKKPVVVSAYQTEEDIVVHTLEGNMVANKGSYIITGIHGEIYPCQKEIFEESYEEVTDGNETENYFRGRDRLIRCEECEYNKGKALNSRILCDNWKVEVDGKGCFYGKIS